MREEKRNVKIALEEQLFPGFEPTYSVINSHIFLNNAIKLNVKFKWSEE